MQAGKGCPPLEKPADNPTCLGCVYFSDLTPAGEVSTEVNNPSDHPLLKPKLTTGNQEERLLQWKREGSRSNRCGPNNELKCLAETEEG